MLRRQQRWRQNPHMSSLGSLRVGDMIVSRLRDGIQNELLAVFRDDMFNVRRALAFEHYKGDYEELGLGPRELVDVFEFRVTGQVMAARLDIIGIDADAVFGILTDQLANRNGFQHDPENRSNFSAEILEMFDEEAAYLAGLGAEGWVQALAASPEVAGAADSRRIGSRSWLLDQIYGWDERFAVRAVLLAFPDAEVVLDITDFVETEVGGYEQPGLLASDATEVIAAMAGMHAPVVVLTEGRTDAEFLKAGLAILYPYLDDLIRFLDYETERRPEGGAPALVRMVRAFAAAGIVNRIVAVFDNDAAAMESLRGLASVTLPPGIKVTRYPDIELANRFPTLGPPMHGSPAGSVSLANVNGLAASIELYLGRDVLSSPTGETYPVQWKSFLPGVRKYQGEVTQKEQIHRAFRAKYAAALRDPALVSSQDWEGLRLILDAIRIAARSTFGE
jgi:hypothetical protein